MVAGGIHIQVKGEAKPWVNSVFLLVGAMLANLVGTTGASMLLIRPWIRMNKYRFTNFHTAFFIFIVSNVGGCLTPVGDPPLFLGYLQGVPFWWVTRRCLPAWARGADLSVGRVLFDRPIQFRAGPAQDPRDEKRRTKLAVRWVGQPRFSGADPRRCFHHGVPGLCGGRHGAGCLRLLSDDGQCGV